MRPPRSALLLCLALLLTGGCRGVRPGEPSEADFLTLSRPGASDPARWTDVRVMPGTGGFRTDLSARPSSPDEAVEFVQVDLTLIRFRGPGDYPLGFGWNRGESRATIQLRDGTRCMTPQRDAGVIQLTAAPARGALAPGDRLEGRFRIHCFPEGDSTSGQQAHVFTGAFAVTVGRDE